MAADHTFEIKTPIKLAKKFGASIYASCREYARTHHRACVVYVLEPITYCESARRPSGGAPDRGVTGVSAAVRQPSEQVITLDHSLGRVLPVGRKMTRPTTDFDHGSERPGARMHR